jgi:hypothetical protein
VIRMGEPNQVTDDAFPWCFDNSVYLSEKLLRRSLREAVFTRVVDIKTRFPADVRHAHLNGTHDCSSSADAAGPRSDAPCSEEPGPRGPEPSESRAALPARKNFNVVAFLNPLLSRVSG